MYISPIEMMQSFNVNPIEKVVKEIADKSEQETEEYVMTAIRNVGINVDKDELLKALTYDRRQYEKGFQDGKSANGEMLETIYSYLGLQFSYPCEYVAEGKNIMDIIISRRPGFCSKCDEHTSAECWKTFFEVYKEIKDEELLV